MSGSNSALVLRSISVREVFAVLARAWWALLLVPISFAGVAFLATPQEPPSRSAQVILLVDVCVATQGAASCDSIIGTEIAVQRAAIYRSTITSDEVRQLTVDKVASLNTVDDLDGAIQVDRTEESPLISFSVRAQTAESAEEIASAHAESVIAYAESNVDGGTSSAGSVAAISVLSGPEVSEPAVSNQLRAPFLAAILGALITVGSILGWWYVNPRLRTSPDVERKTGIPVVGELRINGSGSAAQEEGTVRHVASALRTRIDLFAPRDATPVVLVAGGDRGDLMSALLESYARSGRVAAVLSNRSVEHFRGQVGETCELGNLCGTDGAASDAPQLQKSVLLQIPDSAQSAADLLASPSVQKVLAGHRERVDVVLLDAPVGDDSIENLAGAARASVGVLLIPLDERLARDVDDIHRRLLGVGVTTIGAVTTTAKARP